MKTSRLDFLSFTFEGHDKIFFTRQALSYSKNSMLVHNNFSGIFADIKPDYVDFPSNISYSYPKNKRFFFFLPLFTLYYMVIYRIVLNLRLCIKYRPRVCWTNCPWASFAFGIARKFGWCETSIYYSGDWVVLEKWGGVFRTLYLNGLWGWADYLAAKWSDLVVNFCEEISKARTRHWGKQLAKREVTENTIPLEVHPKAPRKNGNHILFLGQVREDSGFEVMFSLLPDLYHKFGIKLKIAGVPAGPANWHRQFIENQIKLLKLEDYVELCGWVKLEKLNEVAEGCFCGVNLLTAPNTYSAYGTPGKISHYLQMLLPVLATKGISPTTQKIMREGNLGVTTSLDPSEIFRSIEFLYKNQVKFRSNIQEYIEGQCSRSIADYIRMSKSNTGVGGAPQEFVRK